MNLKRFVRKIIYKKRVNEKNGLYNILGNWMYLERDSLGLRENGIYEEEETRFITKFVKPSFICIDIGANIGYYTLIMARRAKHVYAFEPEPNNFEILKKNITINNITNATLYNKAVSDTNGMITLYLCDLNYGMHRIYPSRWCNGKIQVESVRLDDIIDDADFIKMDIEGSEFSALKGMKRLLEKGVSILMEFHPESIREYGYNPLDEYNYIRSFGYRIALPNGREVSYEELEEIATKKVGTNILCTIQR